MLAFIFPGQGSQMVGMGGDLCEAHPEAKACFEVADRVLGFPLSRLCQEGPEDVLNLTENTQPAVLLVSVATLRILQSRGIRPAMFAGHSLGEITANVAAGSIGFEDALRLVRERGRLMQSAVPAGQGGMAALKTGDAEKVHSILARVEQGVVTAANFNGPHQIVISGEGRAVERAIALAKAEGIAGVALAVSGPFHSPLMEPAAARFREILEGVHFADRLAAPIVTNVEARPVHTGAEARLGLERQICHPVRWEESVRRMRTEGVTTFVEVGPGKVLTRLVSRIDRTARTLSTGDCEAIEKTLIELLPAASGTCGPGQDRSTD